MACKYTRNQYGMTPNDFDFTFDYSKIPSNVEMEDSISLSRRLQDLMPLTKILHLNLETTPESYLHNVLIHSSCKLTINNKIMELEFI